MAKAKVNDLQDKILYFGKSTEDSISISLDLSEIRNSSNYKYAYFVYMGNDRDDGCFEYIDPQTATSNTTNITVYGAIDAVEYFPSNATSCDAYIEVVTYNSSGTEVDSHRKKFSARLHADVKPTVGDLFLNPANVAKSTANSDGYNILLSNMNAFGIKIGYSDVNTKGIAWKPTPGSKIVSYTISGHGVATKIIQTNKGYYNYKYPSVNLDNITIGTNLQYTVTVKDARGRTSSLTKTYYGTHPSTGLRTGWSPYQYPRILKCQVVRSNYYGEPSDTGYYACIQDFNAYYNKPVYYNGTNINTGYEVDIQVDGEDVSYRETDNGAVVYLGDAKEHYLGIEVTDVCGGKATPLAILIPSAIRIINIASDGTGVAFGGMATSNTFSCAWDITCDRTITSINGTCSGSDVRLKTNIQDLDVDILDILRPVKYQFITTPDNKTHFGFIAQEVVSALSNEGFDPDSAGLLGYITREDQQLYTLAYDEFIPLVVKKCQELQQENNEMRAEIAEIKSMLLAHNSE